MAHGLLLRMSGVAHVVSMDDRKLLMTLMGTGPTARQRLESSSGGSGQSFSDTDLMVTCPFSRVSPMESLRSRGKKDPGPVWEEPVLVSEKHRAANP